MNNPLLKLTERYKKGNKPTFNFAPFLPITLMKEKRLEFNNILQRVADMTQASLLNFDLGFESITLPFDLNVEAEAIGAEIRYYEGYDGIPVYPTIVNKWVSSAQDIVIPEKIAEAGRVPVIVKCIKNVKENASHIGAVGMFIPGPFTLAGQIMDMDELFVMTMKQPNIAEGIFAKLAEFIIELRDIYVDAGADFIDIEDGGATSISPSLFDTLLLPYLKKIFKHKVVPHTISLTGKADRFMELLMECNPDGIGVDQESDIDQIRAVVPDQLPIFAVCGDYAMLAKATPEEVIKTVQDMLDKGVTSVLPPSDIYPPARIENIKAFIKAVKAYRPKTTHKNGAENKKN